MGTRNLTMVVKDGEFRVAQYGQWDGYPSGQGQTIVKFLLNKYQPAKFREQVDAIKYLTVEQVQERWTAHGADDSGLVSMEVADSFKRKNEHLTRDMGAEILEYIQETPNPEVRMQLDFAADSLFCEYAYLLDLDNDTLEVYRGFNHSPLTEEDRFFFLQEQAEASNMEGDNPKRGSDAYMPIVLIKKYPINELTLATMEELEKELAEEDE